MNKFLESYLSNIVPVSFIIRCEEEESIIGEGTPEFTVKLHKIPEKKDMLASTSLALGEAYIKGDLELDRDLYVVLDDTLSYSCGYFANATDTLYEAQVNKVDHILEKLYLKADMKLLDIGCGWGYLLIRAAKEYGIQGTGITLSKEQYNEFSRRIKEENLEDKLQVKLMDYRELKNSNLSFDRVVSVGMIEHVGRENYALFLENVYSVLKDRGLFLLHFISAGKESPGDPFIKKYIFPGGVIPSLREIVTLLPDYNYKTVDIESLRRHYNKTLLCWRDRFCSHREEIEAMRDKEFARMWELYLTSCAAAFNNGIVDLHQILMSKGVNNDLPMIRK